jgi:hypothetical protein
LKEKEVYNLRSSKTYLLESLENYLSPIQTQIENLTIEHIMPQTITPQWKDALGYDYPRIHTKWLHTLGNLTLTAQNSVLSNKPYIDKSKLFDEERKLTLNQAIIDGIKWDEEAIMSRADALADNALKIWPYPKTNYVEEFNENELYDFSSEDNFYKEQPENLILPDSDPVKVGSWNDLLSKVGKYLYEFSPTEFKELLEVIESKDYFTNDRNRFSNPLEIAPSVFINKNNWVKYKIEPIRNLIEHLELNPEQFQFTLKDKVSNRPPFEFSMIGLKPGDIIAFKNDNTTTAKVLDNKYIELNGERLSLTAATQKVLDNNRAVQGPAFWMYDGKTLSEIRDEIEIQ